MKLNIPRLALVIGGGLILAIVYPNSVIGDAFESVLRALAWCWINVPQRLYFYFSDILHTQVLGGLVAFIITWLIAYLAVKSAKTILLFLIGFCHGFFDELNKILDENC